MNCKNGQEWLWYLDLSTTTLPLQMYSIFLVEDFFFLTISVFDTLVFSQHCYHPFYFAFIIVFNLIYLSLSPHRLCCNN